MPMWLYLYQSVRQLSCVSVLRVQPCHCTCLPLSACLHLSVCLPLSVCVSLPLSVCLPLPVCVTLKQMSFCFQCLLKCSSFLGLTSITGGPLSIDLPGSSAKSVNVPSRIQHPSASCYNKAKYRYRADSHVIKSSTNI